MNQKSTNPHPLAAPTEIDGPGGINMTGGDLTPPQNAGDKLDNLNDERRGAERMERRQMAGQVEEQTHALKPSATDPNGMPEAVTGEEVG